MIRKEGIPIYDWLNTLQDEVCTPIEKIQGDLKSQNDQLYLSITHILEQGSNLSIQEDPDFDVKRGSPAAQNTGILSNQETPPKWVKYELVQ